jgi:hypothetical protein
VLENIAKRAGEKVKATGYLPDDFSEDFYLRVADAYLEREKHSVNRIVSKSPSMPL